VKIKMGLVVALSGIILGILFGLALQRGRLCFNSALRDPLLYREFTLIKAIFFAIALSMIGFSIMVLGDLVNPAPKPFMPFSQTIGGFVFGMGMVLAAACASGVTYKTGEGIMTAFVGLLGLALGAVTAGAGMLSGAKNYLQGLLNIGNLTWVGVIDPTGDVTIYAVVMLIAGVLFTALMVWKFFLPSFAEWKAEQKGGIVDIVFKKGWKWWFTGIFIAVLNMIAWAVSWGVTSTDAAVGNRNYPFSITDGWMGVLNIFTGGSLASWDALTWTAWMVMGLLFGSFIGAKGAGEYKMNSPKTGKPIMLAFIGGLMLGVGAVFSAGCNITNMLSGIPMLSVGSLVFTVFMAFGVWFMAYLIFKVLDKPEILE
jgi:uncharacterized membrane protein YedE/YeeE